MFKLIAPALLVATTLAGCMETTEAETPGPVTSALAGRTLSHSEGFQMTIGADGVLSGTEADGRAMAGTWAEQDGQFCRTLTAPEEWAGTACQDVTVNGDGTVTFTRGDGSTITYMLS